MIAIPRADDCGLVQIALAASQGAGDTKGYGQAAAALAARGIRTLRGGQWTRDAVRRLLQRHLTQFPQPQAAP